MGKILFGPVYVTWCSKKLQYSLATILKWPHSQATLRWYILLIPYSLKHNSINLSEELWVLKSKLTKQSLTFGASKCCFTVAHKSAAGERRVSEVCELSDEPQLSRLKQWPLCVYKKMVTVCSLCVAHSPCAKLIIQMARMINLRTRHLHVEIHLPPAARRVGSSQLVSASRKTSSVNSSTTRLCWSFQWDQRPQDGNFGVVKSTQQGYHRVWIVKGCCKSRWCAFG